MQIDLSGKTALVTGSTAGIGLAIAKGLAEAGAHICINGRTQARVDEAIESLGGSARGVAADLSNADGAAKLFEALPSADILINNLGIYDARDFFDIDDETWMRYWNINVMSGIRVTRHYAKGMVERNWGRIQFISSESGATIPGDMIHYGTTKAAQLAISRGLAVQLSGTNVTVNSVLPGPTHSESIDAFLTRTAEENGISVEEAGKQFIKNWRPTSIIQRVAQTQEVAALCIYLASPQASGTTGAPMRVDGGIVSNLS